MGLYYCLFILRPNDKHRDAATVELRFVVSTKSSRAALAATIVTTIMSWLLLQNLQTCSPVAVLLQRMYDRTSDCYHNDDSPFLVLLILFPSSTVHAPAPLICAAAFMGRYGSTMISRRVVPWRRQSTAPLLAPVLHIGNQVRTSEDTRITDEQGEQEVRRDGQLILRALNSTCYNQPPDRIPQESLHTSIAETC